MQVLDEKNELGVRCYRMMGDSLADVQSFLELTPRKWSSNSSSSNTAEHSWDLGVGYRGALELTKTGWLAGAQDLSSRLSTFMPPRDKDDSWRYDVAGELPDIGRYLAGDPAHMRRHGHPKGHRPIISIAINIRTTWSIKATQMANFGAAMCAIIDMIEHTGRRVELVATCLGNSNQTRLSCGWTVKKAEDPLDLAAVAFSLAHPAAFRRIGFAMFERSILRNDSLYTLPLTTFKEFDLIDPLPGTYCIDGLNNHQTRARTIEDALALAVELVNTAAGEELVTLEG